MTAAILGPTSAPSQVEKMAPQPPPPPHPAEGHHRRWVLRVPKRQPAAPQGPPSPPLSAAQSQTGAEAEGGVERGHGGASRPPAEGESSCRMGTLQGSPAKPGSRESRPEWKRGRSRAGKEEKRVGPLGSCQPPRSPSGSTGSSCRQQGFPLTWPALPPPP